ncbi:TlpA family protein disulfide reductase [Flavobacterium sp. WC2409]|uniref:TlpA family protein disulfide reductase n=1 Tax=Flavobacterium sp. WC2409 TaxID=3234139 RepID=A0AB39W1J5_9FLAO
MKKVLKISIPILILVLITFMGYKVITKITHKREVAEHIKTIPPFSYPSIYGKLFTNKDLKDNTPTLFIYFNSECEHCQSEASQIQENITNFKNFQLVFVSFEEKNKIIAFAKKYKLDSYDNITFLLDKQVTFSTTFDVNSLPTIILYNKNRDLIEKIKGQTKVETILKKLKQ